MKRWRKVFVWGAAIAAPVILVGMPILCFWLWLRPVPLPDWVERVRRPGYSLIYSTETPDHSYYAIFDACDDRLAFCHLDRTEHQFGSMTIITVGGEDVLDTKHRGFTVLTRNILGVYGVIDGTELPIKPGIVGTLRVRYEADGDNLLDAEIPWRTTSQP